MNVGIIGYPTTGKTTVFLAACGSSRGGNIGSVIVPDERFDKIVDITKPKKVTPLHVEFVDDAARIEPGSKKAFGADFFSSARKVDVLIHVVRAFESPFAPYHDDINPLRDQRSLEEELILADFQIIENRMERLLRVHATRQSGTPEQNEYRILEKLKAAVENELPIRSVELGVEEENRIRGYQFLSAKPMICVANISESGIKQGENAPELAELKTYCDSKKIPLVALCATIEKDIAELPAEERDEFLRDLGITSPASNRLIRSAFSALGLITFFTVGESEVRAWHLRKGETALDAAETIHSDLARGFIRAEVTSSKDLIEHNGLHEAQKANKMRLEGKDYVAQDGDIIHIRFKV